MMQTHQTVHAAFLELRDECIAARSSISEHEITLFKVLHKLASRAQLMRIVRSRAKSLPIAMSEVDDANYTHEGEPAAAFL